MIYKSFLLLILLGLTHFPSLNAQQVQLRGKVQDTAKNPVANTNIIATPVSEGHKITFAISNQKGRYKLKLDKGVVYTLAISNLGFSKINDSVQLNEDQIKNYTLHESSITLDQVVIKSKMAVIVKKDTITYRTDKFKTGDERKLREVLKKLPGVEVDREGNVRVNGKRVTKLMVDGKDFFGGDTKLGVNNIPASAVDEVQALDHYNEVGFMKGLSDSDKMALNIKLKKGKKHFLFGESEAGAGVENRYYVHPTVFYYSPKTTVNFIGSFNNTMDAPLDYNDIIRFRGGYSEIFNNPIDDGDDGLDQFLSRSDIRSQKILFGAANLTQEINSKLRLTAYTLAAKQKTDAFSTSNITYLSNDSLQEHRENATANRAFSSISKVKLRYKPNSHTDMAYNATVTAENNTAVEQLLSTTGDSLNQVESNRNPHHVKVAQYFRINLQPNYEHTSKLTGNYTYQKQYSLTNWNLDRPAFPNIIPVEEDEDHYTFLHDYALTTNSFHLNLKHYWVLNNLNHIYPKIGLFYFHQKYGSTDFQRLKNGSVNNFKSAGFDNALIYQLLDPYFGFQYKFKLNKFIFEPGIVYHHYLWKIHQFGQEITNRDKGAFLPELLVKYSFSSNEELELNYHLKSQFQSARQYANRLRLIHFNQLFRGNENLENGLYHHVNLSYHKFDLLHKISFYTHLTYSRTEKSVRSTTTLEGIDQVSSLIYSDLPENSYGFSGRFSKKWGPYQLDLNGKVNLSDYSLIINDNRVNYSSQFYSYRVSAGTNFKKAPNFTLGLYQSLNISNSDDFNSKFLNTNPYVRLRYDFWSGFILKMDYSYTAYENRSRHQINRFQIGNVSLYYSKTDSPWGVEIRMNNMFDVRYKNSNYFDEFRVYDSRTYIQPRTVLFILSYQL